jgi:hypothetical protein
MKIFSALLFCIVCSAGSFACGLSGPATAAIPTQWREVTKSNEEWRHQQPCGPYLSAADDFDGDGRFDEVFFAENSSTHEFAIFAKLSTQPKTILITKLKGIRGRMLDSYSEGENERVCSKDYGDKDCKPGEAIKFTTKYRPVLFGDRERYFFFIWTPESESFTRYQVWADAPKRAAVIVKKK